MPDWLQCPVASRETKEKAKSGPRSGECETRRGAPSGRRVKRGGDFWTDEASAARRSAAEGGLLIKSIRARTTTRAKWRSRGSCCPRAKTTQPASGLRPFNATAFFPKWGTNTLKGPLGFFVPFGVKSPKRPEPPSSPAAFVS
jgi:hypothetical protein